MNAYKKNSAIAGLLLSGALSVSAATVVDLNLNLSGDVAADRSIDMNTSSNQTYNWSSSSPLFNGPATAGNQNLRIYGACTVTGVLGMLGNVTVKLDEASPDTILFQGNKMSSGTADLRAVAFWNAADFLLSGHTVFDNTADSSITIGIDTWLNASGISGTRYVIRDGASYYVSSINGPTAQVTSKTIYGNTLGLEWAEFNINNWNSYSESAAGLGLGDLSFSSRIFNQVSGIGLLGSATRQVENAPIFEVADFQASLVAPPANSYFLTVNHGSGSGFYTNGQQVAISAVVSSAWETFVSWTGDTQHVANASTANTVVTMPAQNIALDVTYSYFTPVSWPDIYVPVYNEMGTNYASYPLVANYTINPSLNSQELTSLAKNFDSAYCVKDNFTKANANYVYGINPKFQVTAYINESHTASMYNYTEPWDVEQSNKTNLLYYVAGNLGVALPATTNSVSFAVNNLFSTLVASSAPPGSKVTTKVGGAYYAVTWLRLGNELMRIEAASNDTLNDVANVTVLRAFSGTKAEAHAKNASVLVPVYDGEGPVPGTTVRIEYYPDPGNPWMAEDRLAFAIYQYDNFRRGIWEDIYGGTLGSVAMGGETLRINSGRLWDFRKNQNYTPNDFFNYYEEGVSSNQTKFYEKYDKHLVFWANNIGSPLDFSNNPEVAALQSTPYKPRPLDGYAQENGIGAYQDGSADIYSYTYTSFSKWSERLQSTMFLGENKLAALAVMMDAGVDNAKFSALPAATRHDLFLYGYASYLMAVKVDTNDLIYTKFAFNPLVTGGSPVLQLDPIFLYRIGRPLETRVSTDYAGYRLPGKTTFMRRFENGLILANPGDNTNVTDTITLDRPYYDPEVGSNVTQVIMKAKSGRILLNPPNSAPVFSADPISRPNAGSGVAYSSTIAGSATDADAGDVLTYSRISGPSWLNVSVSGALSGIPGAEYVGTNVFAVKVADEALAFDTATLNIVVDSAYTTWANQYSLVYGSDGNDDSDSLNNLYEFGLGGNPTNPGDVGYAPTARINTASGSNWFEYVHVKRNDPNSGLFYYLELSTNLVLNSWTNTGYTVVGNGPFTNGFDTVTNRVETDLFENQFIRLQIIEE